MKRFLLTFASVFLAAIVFGRWYAYRQLVEQRRTEAAQREAVERALGKLISTESFAGERKNVEDVLRELAARSDVPLKIERNQMVRKKGLPLLGTVFLPPGEFTLEELLDGIAADAGLGWCRWKEAIVVISRGQADLVNKSFTQVYPLPLDMAGEKVSDDAAELCRLIDTSIEPDSWDEFGGPMVIRPAGGAIVLHHRPDIHRRVRALLANLQSPANNAAREFWMEHWPASGEQRIFEALERIDSIDFVDEPLQRVAEILSQRHGIMIVLARTTLADAAITPDTPITKKLSHVSLRTILREMLGDLKLTYVIRDHVLQISTPEDANSILSNWMYDVRDLVEPSQQRGFEELIRLITSTIQPDSWDSVGGPGTICSFGDRWLAVGQTQGVREQIELMLKHAREILEPAGADEVLLIPPEAISSAVRQALDRPVTLSYRDVPLKDVCDQLTELLGVPVLMRKTLLEDAAVAEDTPITIDLPPLPLRHALALLLSDLNLALEIGSEVLYVTTAEDAESSVDIRLIDVRHLTSPGAGGIDERSLERLIRTEIRPDTWEEAGGPGWMSYYRGLLGVAQTVEIQQEVRHLVDALSEHLLEPASGKSAESVWVGRSTGEEEILARLQERNSLEVSNPKVEETVRMLCARHSIPVLFRKSYRENADDEPVVDVTLEFKDAPLFEILNKLLAEKGGGIATWNGVLFVTDEETAQGALRARLYPVGQRWPAEKKFSGKELARVLVDRVEPNSWWDKAGGRGYSMAVNGEWLLVVQMLEVHRQIEEAIAKLKAGEELPLPSEVQ